MLFHFFYLSIYGMWDDFAHLQEEYVNGDEVGRLQCEHRYHVACVLQWLRVKNWCPICKTSAEKPQDLLRSPHD